METMTGRERIMTALRNQQPDRVPATPDISIMIPCRLTGRPFWDIEVNETPSLTFAYINAVKFFGIEPNEQRNAETAEVISTDASRATVRVIRTDEELMIARSVLRYCEANIAD